MRAGRTLLVLSILTRAGVLVILCLLALLTNYHNLKRAYNHPRLVELSEGKPMRVFYEKTDRFFDGVHSSRGFSHGFGGKIGMLSGAVPITFDRLIF